MRRTLTPQLTVFILALMLTGTCVLPSAMGSLLTNHKFLPNASATSSTYHYQVTNHFTEFYTYTDGFYDVLQNSAHVLYRNGVVNATLPPARIAVPLDYWTFSTTSHNYTKDFGMTSSYVASDSGLRYNMTGFQSVVYLAFEGVIGGSNNYSNWALPKPVGLKNAHSLNSFMNYTECRIGACVTLSGVSTYIINITNVNITNEKNITACAWVRPTAYGGYDARIITKGRTSSEWMIYQGTDGEIKASVDSDAPKATYIGIPGQIPLHKWTHVCMTYTNTSTTKTLWVYKNGVAVGSATTTKNKKNNTQVVTIGNSAVYGREYIGNIDEVYIFDRALSGVEIQRIYNHSCPKGYCIDLVGGSENYIRTTTRSLGGNYSLSMMVYPRYTVMGNLGLFTHNDIPVFTMDWYNTTHAMFYVCPGWVCTTFNNPRRISNWTHVILTYNNKTGDGRIYFDGVEADYNYKANITGLALDGGTYDYFGGYPGVPETNFQGMMDEIRVYNVTLTPEQVQWLEEGTRIDTSLYKIGEYRINMTFVNVSYLYTGFLTNKTASPIINLTGSKINVTVRDEDTEKVITGLSINYTILGGITRAGSTTTGVFRQDQLPYYNYRTLYDANITYSQREDYLNVLPIIEWQQFTLYMSNQTVPVSAVVYDESSTYLEGAIIRWYVQNITTGLYEQRGSATTNFEGKTQLQLKLDTQLYKFTVTYDGRTVLETQPSIVYETELEFQVYLREPYGTSYEADSKIEYRMGFDDSTNEFTLYYTNNAGDTQEACLTAYLMKSYGLLYKNESCSTADSAYLRTKIANLSGTTYLAKFTMSRSQESPIAQFIKDFPTFASLGREGYLSQAVLTIVLALPFLAYPPAIPLALGASFIIGHVAGISGFSIQTVIGICALCVLVTAMVWRRSG